MNYYDYNENLKQKILKNVRDNSVYNNLFWSIVGSCWTQLP